MNKIILIGRLGKDPEMSYTPQGTAKTTFSLATSRHWKDKATNEHKEETTWFNIVLWAALAETAEMYLRKGEQCCIEGRLIAREYIDNQGVNRRVFEVLGERLELLSTKSTPSGDTGAAPTGEDISPF